LINYYLIKLSPLKCIDSHHATVDKSTPVSDACSICTPRSAAVFDNVFQHIVDQHADFFVKRFGLCSFCNKRIPPDLMAPHLHNKHRREVIEMNRNCLKEMRGMDEDQMPVPFLHLVLVVFSNFNLFFDWFFVL